MRLRFNELSLSKLKTDRVVQDFWDTNLPSFGVRVSERGTKTFILKRDNTRYTLGRYPYVSLKQARDEAHRRIGLKYAPRDTQPAQDLIDTYLAEKKPNVRPASFYRISFHLKRDFPNKPIGDISHDAIKSALKPLPPSQQNLAFSFFKTFLNWCAANEYISQNPLARAKVPHKRASRDRLLTDDEVKLIWHDSFNHSSFGNVVRSLILSGQRLGQITQFDRSWLHTAMIVFPAAVMKSGVEHAIPASDALQQHLPSQPIKSTSTAMDALRAQLPAIPHWTLHDFRRYFSSTMAKLKVPIDVTEALLAHTTGSRSQIQRTYDRFDRIEPMREALEHYEEHLFATVLAEQT